MNTESLAKIKATLLSEQKRLTGLLERTHAHKHRSEPLSADFAEQAVETENDQVVEVLDHEGKIELAKIKAALQRLADNAYGKCLNCGNDIQEARLLTIPETEHCISCASELE